MKYGKLLSKKGYDKLVRSSGKTPWQAIGARLYVDIRDNPNTKFVKLKLKPTKFFLKELIKDNDYKRITIEASKEKTEVKFKYKERDLHKYL